MMQRNIHAVFEGGGVKDTGLVGALDVTLQQGYEFRNVAGTSAGAIMAAFVAAGYSAEEMKKIMFALDYRRFQDAGLLSSIPLLGKPLSLLLHKGIYEGDYFEHWIRGLLAQKSVRTFGDLVLFATMMEAQDARYIKDANFMRTIPIETLGIQTTQFDWSFEEYMRKNVKQKHRTETIWQ